MQTAWYAYSWTKYDSFSVQFRPKTVSAWQKPLQEVWLTGPICGIMWPCIGCGDICPTAWGGDGCRMWAFWHKQKSLAVKTHRNLNAPKRNVSSAETLCCAKRASEGVTLSCAALLNNKKRKHKDVAAGQQQAVSSLVIMRVVSACHSHIGVDVTHADFHGARMLTFNNVSSMTQHRVECLIDHLLPTSFPMPKNRRLGHQTRVDELKNRKMVFHQSLLCTEVAFGIRPSAPSAQKGKKAFAMNNWPQIAS